MLVLLVVHSRTKLAKSCTPRLGTPYLCLDRKPALAVCMRPWVGPKVPFRGCAGLLWSKRPCKRVVDTSSEPALVRYCLPVVGYMKCAVCVVWFCKWVLWHLQ